MHKVFPKFHQGTTTLLAGMREELADAGEAQDKAGSGTGFCQINTSLLDSRSGSPAKSVSSIRGLHAALAKACNNTSDLPHLAGWPAGEMSMIFQLPAWQYFCTA